SIYVPPNAPMPARTIVDHPDIIKYVAQWGRVGDLGYTLMDHQTPIGAAWLRLFCEANHGYGFIAPDIPELTIALRPSYRGRGLGTRLLTHLLQAARPHYATVSLSVSRDNPALRLYQRFGFEAVGSHHTALTMQLVLSDRRF
ncbi:MAG: GNAT family N-acetyltransferase, partial [Okeania sp. SIO3B3]|nr:GNAT family N-acetyltransferase [Okeania sp. SIO3B3]